MGLIEEGKSGVAVLGRWDARDVSSDSASHDMANTVRAKTNNKTLEKKVKGSKP